MTDRFDELVGEVDDPRERERLRRVHELLLAAEPPPDVAGRHLVAPDVRAPRRLGRPALLLAATLAVASFGAGWVLGDRDPAPERVVTMDGVGAERDADASIRLLPQDEAGNWPMHVLVRGLEPSRDREDFYELWLTEEGRPIASCGRFVVAEGLTRVTLSVPYGLRRYDGWIVTRAGSSRAVLST